MDERMQAGRHHLTNGERALQQGYPEDGRSHFEAALVQFRGPDLRLGEAHALRGLAQVELAAGALLEAEKRTRGAIDAYQAVNVDLDRLDQRGVSHELRRDAKEGEGAALVLLGEILMRTGRVDEARTALSIGREVASGLGELPSAAAAWSASAKLSLHEGRYEEAEEQLQKTLALHTRSGNAAGETETWLLLAELHRLQRNMPAAVECLDKAKAMAERTNSALHRGQVLAALAALRLQGNQVEEARQTYAESLPFARESGDHELIATILVGLGDSTSRLHEGFGLDHLLEGARVLAGRDQRHGLATALLRIG